MQELKGYFEAFLILFIIGTVLTIFYKTTFLFFFSLISFGYT